MTSYLSTYQHMIEHWKIRYTVLFCTTLWFWQNIVDTFCDFTFASTPYSPYTNKVAKVFFLLLYYFWDQPELGGTKKYYFRLYQ